MTHERGPTEAGIREAMKGQSEAEALTSLLRAIVSAMATECPSVVDKFLAGQIPLIALSLDSTKRVAEMIRAEVGKAEAAALERARSWIVVESNDTADPIVAKKLLHAANKIEQSISTIPRTAYAEAIAAAREQGDHDWRSGLDDLMRGVVGCGLGDISPDDAVEAIAEQISKDEAAAEERGRNAGRKERRPGEGEKTDDWGSFS
jgi:hypothetical protein